MEIVESISADGLSLKGCVMSIGNFDGLHIGHQEILAVGKRTAVKKKVPLVLLSFEPHPAAILEPDKAPELLTPRPMKEKLLAQQSVDCWLIMRTVPGILSLSGPDFIERYVAEPIAPAVVVEGEDFCFGAGRSGDVGLLEKLGAVNGFQVVVVPARKIRLSETIRVSSSVIRYMLQSGDVADAAVALGRAYRLVGKIIPGKGRGKKLGYPTLNMEKPDQLIPAEGVYAGRVAVTYTYEKACSQDCMLPAVFSVGQARTFGDQHPLLIEAHLLNGPTEDVAGQYMAMEFVEHIRRQHKFGSPEELAKQISQDCEKARNTLITGRQR